MLDGKRELREVPVDLLDEPTEPIRRLADVDEMERLCRSVAERGVLVPLVVVQEGKRFRVVAGLRRLHAARATGIVSVPVVVIPSDPGDEAWAMYAENRLREAINPLDEAQWLHRVSEALGLRQSDLAARLQVSESWVSQRIGILAWPADVRSALAEGWLTFAVGRELSQIGAESRRRQALRMAKVSGCTARQAADWRRHWQAEQGEFTVGRGAREYRQPSEDSAQLEVRCELCERVLSEAEQRILMLCQVCKAAVDELRAQYQAKSSSQP